jgi:hypothetical protein
VEPGSEGQCVFIQKQSEIFLHLFLNTSGIEELDNNLMATCAKEWTCPCRKKNKHNSGEGG